MNELPVIRSLCLHTGFRDRHGQTLQITRRKCMANGCSEVQKKNDFSERFSVFAALLSEMDLGNADTIEA